MNTRIVAYLLARLAFWLGGVFVVPLLLSYKYGDGCSDIFIACIMLCCLCGTILRRHGHFNQYTDNISNREGLATAVFAWIMAATLAGLPYVMYGALDPASAFFEGMSGLTTTGASAMTSLEVLPRSLLFWRGMTHWLGGLGIIVIFIAMLPRMSGGAVHLFNAETTGFKEDKLLPRLKSTALTLFSIYLTLTFVETILLMCCGMTGYDAVNHAMATVPTAGFSTYDDSVAHFNSAAAELVMGVFMILSGANFALYYQAWHKGWKTLWEDEEFKYYIIFFFTVACFVTANIFLSMDLSFGTAFRRGFFQVASFASTTGFVSNDYESWPSFAKLLMMVLYFTGGCAGSTAGGIKISRFVVLVKMTLVELRRVLHPQMLFSVKFNGKPLAKGVLASISRFFFLYIICAVVLSVLLAATGVSLTEAIFGIAACISSIGPAFGIIGVNGNFAHISSAGKLVLALAMLLGRLELYTVLVLLRREFWHRDSRW
mgnify:FL=1